MRRLRGDEIDHLASLPRVKRASVLNFLASLPLEIGWANNLANLDRDAKVYRWNVETRRAIEAGIEVAYTEEEDGPEIWWEDGSEKRGGHIEIKGTFTD